MRSITIVKIIIDQSVITSQKQKNNATFINILSFECVKMIFKFSYSHYSKKVKVSQFLSL